ncbi:heme-binding domain protein [compost metagenome]
MKGIKKILLGLLVVLIFIQFWHPARNNSGQVMPNDITKTVALPGEVQGILKKSCYNCHSNQTDYPWYTYIQPLHWYLNNHIQEGKAALNFNEFGAYSSRRQLSKLRAIESSIKDAKMPLPSYTLMHNNAILSESEKALLMSWLEKANESLAK